MRPVWSASIGPVVAVGIVADRAFGEPPAAVHPVARFGQLMSVAERRLYRDDRRRGVVLAAGGVALAYVTGVLLERVLGRRLAAGVATTVAVAGRMLGREAGAIAVMLEGDDLAAARARLPALVGRRPDDLDASEIARAVIESVAENAVDAVVAPVMWAWVAGAPGVLAYRAVNTLDAMVGHRSPRYANFGWASARLDDLANWVPARGAALLVALLRPRRARAVQAVVGRDARHHPSPNGGVVEAAFAAALDVRLGGVNRYGDVVEDRGTLGDGPNPVAGDVRRAVRLLDQLTVALVVVSPFATAFSDRLMSRALPSCVWRTSQ